MRTHYGFSKARRNPYAKRLKKQVTIRLDERTIRYFKSLAEAALSFLGLGTGRAYPSWGQMISLGRDYVTIAWWLPTFPGLAILLTVVAINLVGDRLRDLLDPRVR